MSIEPESADRFLTVENRHTGEILRMRRVRGIDGQTVLILEGSLPPRTSGPPLHVHVDSRETILVKSGLLGVRIGREQCDVPPGKTAVVPAGVLHTWWNAGDEPLELSGRTVPASDLDRFIQAMWAVVNASSSGRPPIFYLAHVLWRHRRTQTVALPPKAVQLMVFPVILLLGTVLGKYRGTAWPGSPASCTGAPETVTWAPQPGGEHAEPFVEAAT
jgi:mannose-6-phosphate isomerase-like protein (cupin superfamily)